MKRVTKLKRQNSKLEIVSIHYFTHRHYVVNEFGDFYRNGIKCDVKPDKNGYKTFFLIDDNGIKLRFKLHRIIIQTYYFDLLTNGLSVDHIDRNPSNNNLSNLRYADYKTQFSNRENKKYKFKKVICLNNNITYNSCKDAENDLNLVNNTVSRVARGERNSIHGYYFKYLD